VKWRFISSSCPANCSVVIPPDDPVPNLWYINTRQFFRAHHERIRLGALVLTISLLIRSLSVFRCFPLVTFVVTNRAA
jgi:hypothetical protein